MGFETLVGSRELLFSRCVLIVAVSLWLEVKFAVSSLKTLSHSSNKLTVTLWGAEGALSECVPVTKTPMPGTHGTWPSLPWVYGQMLTEHQKHWLQLASLWCFLPEMFTAYFSSLLKGLPRGSQSFSDRLGPHHLCLLFWAIPGLCSPLPCWWPPARFWMGKPIQCISLTITYVFYEFSCFQEP